MRNRLWNVNNPNQGSAKKVLCVCSAGLLRSPTAAIVLQKEHGFNTRAVGCDSSHALIPMDQVHLAWADEIVCMDSEQERLIRGSAYNWDIELPPVTVLGIPDSYGYMDESLQQRIKACYLLKSGETSE